MGGTLFKISFNFNGVGLNSSGSSLMSTSMGFLLSVFRVSFSFGGNMSLFLSSIFNLFGSMRFLSCFLGNFSLGFLVISDSNFFSSMDGIFVGLFFCFGSMMMDRFSFLSIMMCFYFNMFSFFMSLLSFSFVDCFFFNNLSFFNFSMVDNFSNFFLLSLSCFWFFYFKVFCFFFCFFFYLFFLNFFSFFNMRKEFTSMMVSSTLWRACNCAAF